ncbi:TIGR04086 family membrane protein [Bacillus sp. V3-13]|uniref:TIGR04086 family membrane protein n=1 Tax=Bacillus sp. V3-13 TaxID=2053728 RepID=UPI000C7920AE|nr:TIGR04086 family membrane protein [Bacillus sp. V3-13]PLR78023.1 TIGR04086 family membrane protein [Bacillus sp. V3-13]
METKNYGTAVLYGLMGIFLLAIVSTFILSLILRFTSVQESDLELLITAFSFVTLFTGGFVSGGKGKQKGWMLGGLTGLVYSLVVFLFNYLGYDSLFSAEQVIYHTCYILIAMMGGILGVNIMGKSRSA